ncbi:DUF2474 domain-containing protein [Providencia vermicola]|uniref:DUF2474 domain-containing protein n=2 Tax=Providencia TaxID=586 RepID=A0AAI9I3G2_PROST|nr:MULTISPECIES: DUF2474 domain-containing protein [Providencia]ELR5046226.1 DUF2474 domain-containing protein [Providencia rettgeri]ELR5037593.1 DUF2474 domain-containing protein [Providencia stuartii]ELR5120139.1 DUF2474 domain-containing protein [Providencia stuartii]ELR5143574.1 DUF2474 domain-containing protein [Providencia stuartii]ELR5292259.1 DUF2474 domain-containing protein [Providencia stuartii]
MSSEEKLPQTKATTNHTVSSPWWKKIGWMAIIWFGSVLALFAFSSLFRLLMTAAGMKVK